MKNVKLPQTFVKYNPYFYWRLFFYCSKGHILQRC